jgi:hypothetical protein
MGISIFPSIVDELPAVSDEVDDEIDSTDKRTVEASLDVAKKSENHWL